jgi:hypothetical protein
MSKEFKRQVALKIFLLKYLNKYSKLKLDVLEISQQTFKVWAIISLVHLKKISFDMGIKKQKRSIIETYSAV